MKRTAIIILLALSTASIFASGDHSFWGGYTTTSGGINAIGLGPTFNTYATSGSGYTAVFQVAYWYYHWWGAGIKISKTSLTAYEKDLGSNNIISTTNADNYSFLPGIPFLFDFDPFAFGLDIYAGYCSSSVNARSGNTLLAAAIGGGFESDIDAKFSYYLCPSFSIDLKAGYRFAKDIRMYATQSINSIHNNDYLGSMDFSGPEFGFGLNYRWSSKYGPWYDGRGCCK